LKAVELKAAEARGADAARKAIIDTAVGVAFPGAVIGKKVAEETAKVGTALVSENAKDIKVAGAVATLPFRATEAATKATFDHVTTKPVEATLATIVAGPAGLVTDVVVNQPAVQKATGAVIDTVKDEAKDTALKMAKHPLLPVLGIVEKGAEVQAKVTTAAVAEVVQIPANAKKFDEQRPTTAAVIDIVPLVPAGAKTIMKGGLQKASDVGQNLYDRLPELPKW